MNKLEKLKQYHKNTEKIIKSEGSVDNDAEVEDRVIRFIGSTEGRDRDDEVIRLNGWDLKNFKKSPTILVNHQYHELPVAKAEKVWIDKEKKALMFDIRFPEPEISSVGDSIYKLYKNGYMTATSVGFKPDFEKMEFGQKSGEPRVTYNGQELLELSLVSVPANPEALMAQKGIQKAMKDEVIDDLEMKELIMFINSIEKKKDNLEKNKKIEKEKKNQDDVHSDDVSNINKNREKKYECKSCGQELKCYCSECQKEQDQKEFFQYLYKMLLEK